ncbi:hypothetical protein AAC03nite_39020 [Alicyclobacillus acidoterrestris]|nr:hypothetical protein AAC03nite_39020 [Alicyclobacillus acidoterrestris]
MAQYQITVDEEILHGLFHGDEGVGRLLEQVVNQILLAQVSKQLQATPYQRTRRASGVPECTLTTRVGRLTLRVPRVRNSQFSTELFLRYQRSEQALILALMEMVVNGVSTRKVTRDFLL